MDLEAITPSEVSQSPKHKGDVLSDTRMLTQGVGVGGQWIRRGGVGAGTTVGAIDMLS